MHGTLYFGNVCPLSGELLQICICNLDGEVRHEVVRLVYDGLGLTLAIVVCTGTPVSKNQGRKQAPQLAELELRSWSYPAP